MHVMEQTLQYGNTRTPPRSGTMPEFDPDVYWSDAPDTPSGVRPKLDGVTLDLSKVTLAPIFACRLVYVDSVGPWFQIGSHSGAAEAAASLDYSHELAHGDQATHIAIEVNDGVRSQTFTTRA